MLTNHTQTGTRNLTVTPVESRIELVENVETFEYACQFNLSGADHL